jgi:hypothetical protein
MTRCLSRNAMAIAYLQQVGYIVTLHEPCVGMCWYKMACVYVCVGTKWRVCLCVLVQNGMCVCV